MTVFLTDKRRMLVSAVLVACLALSACGGGGGGGGLGSTPTPPPPPPPPGPTGAFLVPGVTATTTFTALGWEETPGDSSFADLASTGFAVRYDSASQTYFMDFPSTVEGPFTPTSSSSSVLMGQTGDDQKTGAHFPIDDASYTRSGYYYRGTPYQGYFVFGSVTPSSGIPTSGNASYVGNLQGAVIGAIGNGYGVGGTATFTFDFAAATLSGTMQPTVNDGWGIEFGLGTYDLKNTMVSAAASTFSGSLLNAQTNLAGAFNGFFTGPNANELMSRFSLEFAAPYEGPNGKMYGVVTGKRQ